MVSRADNCLSAQTQPALKPLLIHPFVLARWKQAKVNLDYHIEVERHYYSVPYWFVRHEVGVKISEQFIEIFYGHKRIAAHLQGQASYHYTSRAYATPSLGLQAAIERTVFSLGPTDWFPDSGASGSHLWAKGP